MALTRWNMFVKKVFHEGRKTNKTYKFKDALKDASRRKSEMNTMENKNYNKKNHNHNKNKSRKTKKRRSK